MILFQRSVEVPHDDGKLFLVTFYTPLNVCFVPKRFTRRFPVLSEVDS